MRSLSSGPIRRLIDSIGQKIRCLILRVQSWGIKIEKICRNCDGLGEVFPVKGATGWRCPKCQGTGTMENIEFKIHELPPTKSSDVIEIKFKKSRIDVNLIRSLEENFRKCGHEGLILILPPDDEVSISVKESISDQNNKES